MSKNMIKTQHIATGQRRVGLYTGVPTVVMQYWELQEAVKERRAIRRDMAKKEREARMALRKF